MAPPQPKGGWRRLLTAGLLALLLPLAAPMPFVVQLTAVSRYGADVSGCSRPLIFDLQTMSDLSPTTWPTSYAKYSLVGTYSGRGCATLFGLVVDLLNLNTMRLLNQQVPIVAMIDPEAMLPNEDKPYDQTMQWVGGDVGLDTRALATQVGHCGGVLINLPVPVDFVCGTLDGPFMNYTGIRNWSGLEPGYPEQMLGPPTTAISPIGKIRVPSFWSPLDLLSYLGAVRYREDLFTYNMPAEDFRYEFINRAMSGRTQCLVRCKANRRVLGIGSGTVSFVGFHFKGTDPLVSDYASQAYSSLAEVEGSIRNPFTSAFWGGLIAAFNSSISVMDSVFSSGSTSVVMQDTTGGGAIGAVLSNVFLFRVGFVNCSSPVGGAVMVKSCRTFMADCYFVGNTAVGPIGGGAMRVEPVRRDGLVSASRIAIIVRSTFKFNVAAFVGGPVDGESGADGGALSTTNTHVFIFDSSFVGNHADADGGAIRIKNDTPTTSMIIILRDSFFGKNVVKRGSGSAIYAANVFDFIGISGCTFIYNSGRSATVGVRAFRPARINGDPFGTFALFQSKLVGCGAGYPALLDPRVRSLEFRTIQAEDTRSDTDAAISEVVFAGRATADQELLLYRHVTATPATTLTANAFFTGLYSLPAVYEAPWQSFTGFPCHMCGRLAQVMKGRTINSYPLINFESYNLSEPYVARLVTPELLASLSPAAQAAYSRLQPPSVSASAVYGAPPSSWGSEPFEYYAHFTGAVLNNVAMDVIEFDGTPLGLTTGLLRSETFATFSLTNCKIRGVTASSDTDLSSLFMIASTDQVTIVNVTAIGPLRGSSGTVLSIFSLTFLALMDIYIEDSSAAVDGGAVAITPVNTLMEVTRLTCNRTWAFGVGGCMSVAEISSNSSIRALNNITCIDTYAGQGGCVALSNPMRPSSPWTIDGFRTLRSSASAYGGALLVSNGWAWINHMAVDGSRAGRGGALGLLGSSATIQSSTFSNMQSTESGGVVFIGQPPLGTITQRNWGALSDLTCEGSVVMSYNSAGSSGGAVAVTANGLFLMRSGCWLLNNEAQDSGGAVFAEGDGATLVIESSGRPLRYNKAVQGGAISLRSGARLIVTPQLLIPPQTAGSVASYWVPYEWEGDHTEALVLEDNAARQGGALYARSSTIYAPRLTCSGNTAELQGGCFALYEGCVALCPNCTFVNNTAAGGSGGAVYASGASFAVSDGVFQSNVASDLGGGVAALRSVFLSHDTQYLDNKAHGIGMAAFRSNAPSGGGGAVFLADPILVALPTATPPPTRNTVRGTYTPTPYTHTWTPASPSEHAQRGAAGVVTLYKPALATRYPTASPSASPLPAGAQPPPPPRPPLLPLSYSDTFIGNTADGKPADGGAFCVSGSGSVTTRALYDFQTASELYATSKDPTDALVQLEAACKLLRSDLIAPVGVAAAGTGSAAAGSSGGGGAGSTGAQGGLPLLIAGVRASRNSAAGTGGFLSVAASSDTLVLWDSAVEDCEAAGAGGGIYTSGPRVVHFYNATVRRSSTVRGNGGGLAASVGDATKAGSSSSGLSSAAGASFALHLHASKFADNRAAAGLGPAAYLPSDGAVVLGAVAVGGDAGSGGRLLASSGSTTPSSVVVTAPALGAVPVELTSGFVAASATGASPAMVSSSTTSVIVRLAVPGATPPASAAAASAGNVSVYDTQAPSSWLAGLYTAGHCVRGWAQLSRSRDCVFCRPGSYARTDALVPAQDWRWNTSSFGGISGSAGSGAGVIISSATPSYSSSCAACPPGAVCMGGSGFVPQVGQWRAAAEETDPRRYVLLRCLYRDACRGAEVVACPAASRSRDSSGGAAAPSPAPGSGGAAAGASASSEGTVYVPYLAQYCVALPAKQVQPFAPSVRALAAALQTGRNDSAASVATALADPELQSLPQFMDLTGSIIAAGESCAPEYTGFLCATCVPLQGSVGNSYKCAPCADPTSVRLWQATNIIVPALFTIYTVWSTLSALYSLTRKTSAAVQRASLIKTMLNFVQSVGVIPLIDLQWDGVIDDILAVFHTLTGAGSTVVSKQCYVDRSSNLAAHVDYDAFVYLVLPAAMTGIGVLFWFTVALPWRWKRKKEKMAAAAAAAAEGASRPVSTASAGTTDSSDRLSLASTATAATAAPSPPPTRFVRLVAWALSVTPVPGQPDPYPALASIVSRTLRLAGTSTIITLLVFYQPISTALLSLATCNDYGDGKPRLASSPDIICLQSDAHVSLVMRYVLPGSSYILGVPLICSWLLFRYRHALSTPAAQKVTGFLTVGLKSTVPHCFFELLFLARKVGFMVLIVLSRARGPQVQVVLGLGWFAAFFALHLRFHPHADAAVHKVETTALACLLLILFLASFLTGGSTSANAAAGTGETLSLASEAVASTGSAKPLTRVTATLVLILLIIVILSFFLHWFRVFLPHAADLWRTAKDMLRELVGKLLGWKAQRSQDKAGQAGSSKAAPAAVLQANSDQT